MLIIGHRGNTLRIIKWYLKVNTPIIEVDARYINGEFYAVHGPSPIRRASIPGRIMAWIDYHFFYRDPLLKKLTLREILSLINNRADVMIDVKQMNIEEILVDYIEKTGFNGKIYITSELHPVIKRIKAIKPEYITIASINIYAVNMVRIALDAEADMASINLSLINKELVEDFHSEGIGVLTWTVNDIATARMMSSLGVDGIVTDCPDVFVKYFNSAKRKT